MNEAPYQVEKKKGGCGKAIGCGCLSVVLLLAGGGFFVYRNFSKIVAKVTAEYTSDAPARLPSVEATPQEVASLQGRVEAFSKAVKEGRPGQSLTLTSRDLNVLIQKSPAWSSLAGKVVVNLEGDRVHGEACIPLEAVGGPFKGRWLNGAATFRVETAAGRLLVFLDALSVRGKALPESVMKGLSGKNLAEDANRKPELASLMEKVESVAVRDGQLRIKSK